MTPSESIKMEPDIKQRFASPATKTGLGALRTAAVALSLGLALSACERAAEPPAVAGDAPATTPVPNAAATAATTGASVQSLLAPSTTEHPLPADSAALAAVYGHNDRNADEYALPDGRYVGFWHGYAYRSDDIERYTALVYAEPPNEDGIAAPGQQVDLAQISYTLRDGAWQQETPQTDVGRFGGMGQAPQFDSDRMVLTYEISPQRGLLAIPSAATATGGVRIRNYELFAVDGQRGWRHAGTVQAGADYSASCRNGPSTPDTECVRNSGSLRFEQTGDGSMPAITINLSGSTRGDNGVIRPAGPEDSRRYRYDDASAAYRDISGH